LFSISGYICHGGWKEPLASRNTFSKVQDLKDQQQSHMPQYQHSAVGGGRSSGGLYGNSGSLGPADQRHLQQYYVVISEAERPRQRICVRLVMDHDNSNVSLWANSRHCPPPIADSTASAAASNQPQYQLSNDRSSNELAGGLNQNNGQLWSFNLTRTSKWSAKNKKGSTVELDDNVKVSLWKKHNMHNSQHTAKFSCHSLFTF
jgi:hypothetical protein